MAPSRVIRCPIGRRFKPEQVPPGRGPAAALGLAPDHGVTETGVAEASTNDHTAIVDRSGRAKPEAQQRAEVDHLALAPQALDPDRERTAHRAGPASPSSWPTAESCDPACRSRRPATCCGPSTRSPSTTYWCCAADGRPSATATGWPAPWPESCCRPLTAETPTPGTPATVPATGQRLTQARHLADQPPTNPSHAHPEGSWTGTGPSASRIHATQGLPPSHHRLTIHKSITPAARHGLRGSWARPSNEPDTAAPRCQPTRPLTAPSGQAVDTFGQWCASLRTGPTSSR